MLSLDNLLFFKSSTNINDAKGIWHIWRWLIEVEGINFLTCKDRLRNELLQGSQVNRGFLGCAQIDQQGWDTVAPRQADLTQSVCCTFMWGEHRRARSFPHWLLQLQHWLKTEPLCGVNTNSQKLALLWEFYSLMEKNGRKGILMFSFYREPQCFETCSSIHSGVYLGA